MTVDERDLRFLERCVELAEQAVRAGDEPFGSVLVDPDGRVLFEDHNHVAAGDGTRHPELAMAQWAAANVPPGERPALTVYTSGEHCAMCSAAHAWAGLGRIVYATSTEQLTTWLSELGVLPGPVAPLRIGDVVPNAVVDGPALGLADRVRALHERYHAGSASDAWSPRYGAVVSSESEGQPIDLDAINAERERIRSTYLQPEESRPGSTARGLHHFAIVCSEVEETVRFYQGLLGFPLTDIFENRDYAGSNHFFFDIGNGNLLAFFDFPGLDVGPYAEVLGGLHHVAISVEPEKWEALRARLDEAGVEYQTESGTSIYFRDPNGARLELLADPLGEMYGTKVL